MPATRLYFFSVKHTAQQPRSITDQPLPPCCTQQPHTSASHHVRHQVVCALSRVHRHLAHLQPRGALLRQQQTQGRHAAGCQGLHVQCLHLAHLQNACGRSAAPACAFGSQRAASAAARSSTNPRDDPQHVGPTVLLTSIKPSSAPPARRVRAGKRFSQTHQSLLTHQSQPYSHPSS